MLRRLIAPTWLFAVLGSSVALAETPAHDTTVVPNAPTKEAPVYGWKRDVVRVDPRPGEPAPALISQIIYLNRCVGGCQLNPGNDDDASTTVPTSGLVDSQVTLSEFAHSQQVWDDFVTCMREIYSPFDVQITETRPGPGSQYHMAVVAGTSQEAGKDGSILGQAIVRGDCAPRNNAVSLSFANSHAPNSQLVFDLCYTVGQESAHAFGLDHSFKWLDGRSTCNDPMTYQSDCGGQRFYRNDTATCGEFSMRPCNCGSSQNSHAKILATFGPNQAAPLIGPPTSAITTPASGGALGAIVAVSAGSKRGVAKVELILNGFKWAEVKGAQFGTNGQPNPSNYTLTVPPSVPNSIIDIVARTYDDLGRSTDSATVTVTKGAPCADATTCAAGQKCEAGKCFWDPPSGELGDSCTYPQFCKSLNCNGPEGALECTQNCVPGSSDSCPEGLECLATGAADGICYTKSDDSGCCSVGGDDDGPSPWLLHGGISALLLGILLRRRRK